MASTEIPQKPRSAGSSSFGGAEFQNVHRGKTLDQPKSTAGTASLDETRWEAPTRPTGPQTNPPRPIEPGVTVDGLERWDGAILESDDSTFTAELRSPDGARERRFLAVFPRELLGPDDEPAAGDLVYVTVRKVSRRDGLVNTTTSVRLRRLGLWEADEIEKAQRMARSAAVELADLAE